MKLKPLSSSIPAKRFYLEKTVTEGDYIEITASDDYERIYKISADSVVHMQITEDTLRYDTFTKLIEAPEDEKMIHKEGHKFFKILDSGYTDWLKDESNGFFNQEIFHPYVLFFSNYTIDLVCADEPVCQLK